MESRKRGFDCSNQQSRRSCQNHYISNFFYSTTDDSFYNKRLCYVCQTRNRSIPLNECASCHKPVCSDCSRCCSVCNRTVCTLCSNIRINDCQECIVCIDCS